MLPVALKNQLPLPNLLTMMASPCFLASESPRRSVGSSCSACWGRTLRHRGTPGTMLGRQVGSRLLKTHLNDLCFISCCWVMCCGSLFFYTVFLYAFCKVALTVFVQEKSKNKKTSCCKGLVYFERQVYLEVCI